MADPTSPTNSERSKSSTADVELDVEQAPHYGGMKGWRTVLGAWLVLFASFGYLYSYGAYQDYYTRFYLSHFSPSKIAWIGSFQLMIPFLMGMVSGKLFDAGHFHALQLVGGTVQVVSLFGLSLAKPQQYSPIFLSQGLGVGLGLGFIFVPTLSVVSLHFHSQRGWASGVAMSGICVGGIVFPIMVNNLLGKIGFGQTVRATAYVVLGLLVIGNILMRMPDSMKVGEKLQPNVKSFFTDIAYICAAVGALVLFLGFYFPLIYLQLYAAEHGIDKNLALYSIPILNASSIPGRLVGNYLVDVYGPINVLIVVTIFTGASIFSVFGIHSSGSLIAVALFYGWFSGAWISVSVAGVASLARHQNEVGARVGIALAVGSIGAFFSGPIQGHLLTPTFVWFKPIIFSGIFVTGTTILFLVARQSVAKERGRSKV